MQGEKVHIRVVELGLSGDGFPDFDDERDKWGSALQGSGKSRNIVVAFGEALSGESRKPSS
jgi:hypothetical protein